MKNGVNEDAGSNSHDAKHTPNKIFFFCDVLTTWYLSNTLAITVSLPLYLFNLILSKIKPSYSNLLLITFAIIINGQLKQLSKMESHIWKWPIITAVSSGVKLDLILGMMIYQAIILFFIFQKYCYWKILEVSVFK